MKLMDRDLQRALLSELAEVYPEAREPDALDTPAHPDAVMFNAMYLHEHDLVAARTAQLLGVPPQLVDVRITAKGLDFLQDDGGLGAILNVVTVRLDADTIRGLVEDKIDATAMPPEDRSKLKQWLASAGQEALKEATKRLVQAGLDHAPNALLLLQMLRG